MPGGARAESIWRADLGVVVLPLVLASAKGYATSVKDGQGSEVFRHRQGEQQEHWARGGECLGIGRVWNQKNGEDGVLRHL